MINCIKCFGEVNEEDGAKLLSGEVAVFFMTDTAAAVVLRPEHKLDDKSKKTPAEAFLILALPHS